MIFESVKRALENVDEAFALRIGKQTRVIAPEIGRLPKLVELIIRGPGVTALPPEIGALKRLEKLQVDDCRLATIPPELGKLPRLRTLHVSSCGLTSLPDLSGCKALEGLFIDNNDLTDLPPGLSGLRKLTALQIINNPIRGFPAELTNLRRRMTIWCGGSAVTPAARKQIEDGDWGLLEPVVY